jgi:PAS domain S-box-containing protein
MVAFNPRFLELLEFPPDRFQAGDHFEKFIGYNAERGEYGPGDAEEQVRARVELAGRFEPHKIERVRPDGTVIDIRGNPLPGGGFVTTYQDVTESRRAEDALRQSEASLGHAQRIAHLGNWDWDIANNAVTWSDETYRILGLAPRERDASYASFELSVHPDDRERVKAAFAEALAGAPFVIDHRLVLADESVRTVHEEAEVEFDASGRAVFMRGTIQDVTEQRRAATAVRDNERFIRAVMDNVADALVTMSETGTIETVNHAVETLFGYGAEELIGRNVSVLMPEPIRSSHDGYLHRYLRTGQARVLGVAAREVPGQHKDGTVIDVELTVSEMRHAGRRLFIGGMRDITERKLADESLRQKTAFVALSKSVAAAANEALTVEGAFQVCVDEICRHTGWPIGHVYMHDTDGGDELAPTAIWHLKDRQTFETFRRVTMTTLFAPGEGLPGRVVAERRSVCIRDVTADSNFPRARKAKDIGVRGGFGFPVFVGAEVAAVLEFFTEEAAELDRETHEVMIQVGNQLGRVIERARAETALLQSKETAEYANRTKSEFLATMSHELRTPLNAIIGFSEVMMQEMFGPLGHTNYQDYAQDIRASGNHLLNIINDILDVSKAEAGMIDLADERVDLSDLIEASLRLVRPRAEEKNLAFDLNLPDAPVRIVGDGRRLKQVLLNLLSNAVKFTTEGTASIRLRASHADGVTLQVTDTGIGIAEPDLHRIMEPFTQVDSTLSRTYDGTGLGLPLSRALIELHGGELTVDSSFGKGTVATVRLPAERLVGSENAA